MAGSLEGRTFALAEGRQLEDLTGMLTKEGAAVVRCPMVSILDAPDPAPVEGWLRDLTADRFQLVVLLTGEGLRRLLASAERSGTRDAVIAALRRTRVISRGPKPVAALREIGLAPAVVVSPPTTDGVIAALSKEPLAGVGVGLQLYREDNPPLESFLRQAGADLRTVSPYVYAPAADADQVVALVDRLAGGDISMMVFTSSPQVDRLFEVAADRRLTDRLRAGLGRTPVAVVGPVVADTLRELSVRVDVCPSQGFVMKNLVNQIKRHFAPPTSSSEQHALDT